MPSEYGQIVQPQAAPAVDARRPAAWDAQSVAAENAGLREAAERLEAERARLAGLVRSHTDSARLHAARAAVLGAEVRRRDVRIRGLERSTSWRLTAPLRIVLRLLRPTRPGETAKLDLIRRALTERAPAAARRAGRGLRRIRAAGLRLLRGRPPSAPDPLEVYERALARPAAEVVAPRVLIIAELSVPQCAKYRVWQKQEHFARLGHACTVVDWRNPSRCRSALQVHALAIFYRVPGEASVLPLFAEARRLGVPSYWEVDDLIFDERLYLENRNLDRLSPSLRKEVVSGVPGYRAGLLACDRAIASTDTLAARMRAAGVPVTVTIENSLDDETLAAAATIRDRRRAAQDRADGEVVRVVYGSGTKTHDVDFACAAPALIELMRARPQVLLRIVGELTLPEEFAAFGGRVERMTGTGYRAWLDLLGECDISLAPLEASVFNDAKSNIKLLEASVLGLPSVCSPRDSFRAVIRDGEDGMLADDDAGWLAALLRLVDDAGLRRRIGGAALRAALDRYAPEAIAQTQVAPLVAGLDRRRRRALRVLVVNIFFAPRSFGGATIVAEEVARRLHARADTEAFVFTSSGNADDPPDTLLRYEEGDMPIIGVRLPEWDSILGFDNPRLAEVFADVLAAVQPDVVHFHSVQGLSAALLRTCQERRVPYVVTLHDAWWLCERQFMVRGDGKYCFQTAIDLRVCQVCIPQSAHLAERSGMLLGALKGAERLLAPSAFHRSLHLANGIAPDHLVVDPNGVRMPRHPRRRRAGATLRFGYVGGNERVKGIHLVRRAFEGLAQTNYTLVLVDNTLNLGFPSIDVRRWKVAGRIEVVPAYRQEEIDAFFEGIDVLLFPSQWKESFGLTVREALVRDVWVIVTEGGGAAEAVTDGVNGTIIPLDGRADKLRAAIAALLDAPERLAGYRNPDKSGITTFDAQAAHVRDILAAAAHATGRA